MTTAISRGDGLGVGTWSTSHVIGVLSVRASVALRLKTDPRTLFVDVVEPIIGHVVVVVPWGTSTRIRIDLADIAAADVTRHMRHQRVREIAREQRAHFASRSR